MPCRFENEHLKPSSGIVQAGLLHATCTWHARPGGILKLCRNCSWSPACDRQTTACTLKAVHACTPQVSIVAFKKGQLRVLSHAWDRNMGGRALDDVLFNYFAAEFQEKYKLDVRTNLRAAFRLRVGCEKVRPACMLAVSTS